MVGGLGLSADWIFVLFTASCVLAVFSDCASTTLLLIAFATFAIFFWSCHGISSVSFNLYQNITHNHYCYY